MTRFMPGSFIRSRPTRSGEVVRCLEGEPFPAEPMAARASYFAIQPPRARHRRGERMNSGGGAAGRRAGATARTPDAAERAVSDSRAPHDHTAIGGGAPVPGLWSRLVQRKPAETGEAPRSVAGPPALIIEAGTVLLPGQMTRSEFLSELRAQVLATCDAVLGPDWSAVGCPFIEAWFERHRDSNAATLEQLARHYSGLSTADHAAMYIAAAADRLRIAVARWRDGQDITTDLHDAESAEGTVPLEPVQPKSSGAGLSHEAGGIAARLGSGVPLDPATATRLGPALGGAAPEVRIHTDPDAGQLAREVNSEAFTLGSHVAFAPGRYRPGHPEGDALLAHELAHVRQQRSARWTPGTSLTSSERLETEADRVALSMVAHVHGDDSDALARAAISLKSGLALARCSTDEAQKRKERIASLEKRKAGLDVIKGSPTTSSFGVLAAAITESVDVEHKLGVEKTGRGILTGTRSGETPPAGAKKSDCTILVLDVLEQAFTAQGKAADWKKVRKKALEIANARGGGISGIDIQKALVGELGWKGIFWAPDPTFAYTAEADKSEHAYAYRKVREAGTYYGLSIEQSVVNYAPRQGSKTAEETTQLDRLSAIPFGVLSARGAKHMALLVRGVVYEVHWTETSDKPDVIEGTSLKKWAWLSGAVVVPPEDFKDAFRGTP